MESRASEGDVYVVPLQDGREALCRILYKSNYFKHVALVGCYGLYVGTVPRSEDLEPQLLGTPLYTTVQPMKTRNWRRVENRPVSSEERQLSKRLVGGEIWIGDEHLGPPQESDLGLRQMDTHGDRIFLRKIAELF